jgi:hypothetical protein
MKLDKYEEEVLAAFEAGALLPIATKEDLGLTIRSTGPIAACGKGPPFHSGPLATYRNGPVSSNVEPRRLRRNSGAAVVPRVAPP